MTAEDLELLPTFDDMKDWLRYLTATRSDSGGSGGKQAVLITCHFKASANAAEPHRVVDVVLEPTTARLFASHLIALANSCSREAEPVFDEMSVRSADEVGRS